MKVLTRIILLLIFSYVWLPEISAQQPLVSFEIKKPKGKNEDKILRSEKTGSKKWTVVRRFTQNGVTKFNWHFNANAKLEEIIERAKLSFKDDYTQLLPLYNYSLEQTKTDRELDSVINKTNTGILIHDLRNTWIDNLYMLMGKAYYFKKEFDTAYLTFQYINYVFSPREKDGYDLPIGSNANEGGNAFSISTKEKTDVLHKVWTTPPSRNEAFIWQIRTFLARDETPEAAGLIETLRNDPQFPERLRTDLYEVQAWWFYKQSIYDSASIYLEKALPNAQSRQEKARWEYLIAQLSERTKDHARAQEFYSRVVNRTLDPVMEVYARLNSIRQNKGDEKAIQENIDALLKMARREKYINYRDIIYFAAAQIELERNNVAGAKALLLKATRYINPNGDNANRSKAFLALANLSYNDKLYKDAKNYYDSVTVVDTSLLAQKTYDMRKGSLGRIVEQLSIIERQDSLQRIANMPEAEREAFLRKLVRQLRKQQGIKEEDTTTRNNSNQFNNNNAPAPDLFGDNAKTDWYFYNAALKGKGFTEFKNKWGSRQNVDNWRRMDAVRQSINQAATTNAMAASMQNQVNNEAGGVSPYSYEGLLKKLPLTPQQLNISNDSIEIAQFNLGKAYLDGLEDYYSAITVLENFNDRFPGSDLRAQALFSLYYCYYKTGNTGAAARVAKELKDRFAGTDFEKTVSHPQGTPEENTKKSAMNLQYDKVYNLFIEGNFAEALAQKALADSLYGKSYWTPQLLYIQSVYYIRQRQDSTAIAALQNIISTFPNSPMVPKVKTLIDVLGRRKQIEDYLTKLEIKRPKEDSLGIIDDKPQQPVVVQKPVIPPVVDSVKDEPVIRDANLAASGKIKKDSTQNRQKPTISDSLKRAPLTINMPAPKPAVTDTVQQKPPVVAKDTTATRSRPIVIAPGKPVFNYDPNAPHLVALVLLKVDPVYITEARNAFNRFNKEKYFSKSFTMGNQPVTDTSRLLTISTFENGNTALDYMEKARKAAPIDLIPWLPVAKYSFITITEENLRLLLDTKDLDTYKAFLRQVYPGKF